MADDDNVTPIKKPRTRRPRGIVPAAEPGAAEHELRLQGKTWSQIAKALGHTSPTTAHGARERFLQRAGLALAKEKREEALMMEMERLDTLQSSYWEAATRGYETGDPEIPRRPDVKAAEVILKIIAHRSKLLGLDEADRTVTGPRTIVVTGNSDQYVATLKTLIAGDVVDAEVIDDE